MVFEQVPRAPECCHPGAFEEEVGEVLLRDGAVLVDARAMAVEEALRRSVAVAENLEEYTQLDGGEIVPVHIRKGDRAAGGFQHLVDGTKAEALLSAPEQVAGVGSGTQAEARQLGVQGRQLLRGDRAEAALQWERQSGTRRPP
jgi:hypothetical protein